MRFRYLVLISAILVALSSSEQDEKARRRLLGHGASSSDNNGGYGGRDHWHNRDNKYSSSSQHIYRKYSSSGDPYDGYARGWGKYKTSRNSGWSHSKSKDSKSNKAWSRDKRSSSNSNKRHHGSYGSLGLKRWNKIYQASKGSSSVSSRYKSGKRSDSDRWAKRFKDSRRNRDSSSGRGWHKYSKESKNDYKPAPYHANKGGKDSSESSSKDESKSSSKGESKSSSKDNGKYSDSLDDSSDKKGWNSDSNESKDKGNKGGHWNKESKESDSESYRNDYSRRWKDIYSDSRRGDSSGRDNKQRYYAHLDYSRNYPGHYDGRESSEYNRFGRGYRWRDSSDRWNNDRRYRWYNRYIDGGNNRDYYDSYSRDGRWHKYSDESSSGQRKHHHDRLSHAHRESSRFDKSSDKNRWYTSYDIYHKD